MSLSIIRIIEDGRRGQDRRAVYLCSCGLETVVNIGNVKSGHTQSCGCLRRKVTGERALVHGHGIKRTTVYTAWRNMRQRCMNSNRADFKNYGGRGITICERWDTFANFLADMGEPAKGATLDRIDNERGYSKDNCRWASRAVQNLNRRHRVLYDYAGKSQTLAEWSRELGIGPVTLLKRLQRGVPIELAFSVKGYLDMSKFQ